MTDTETGETGTWSSFHVYYHGDRSLLLRDVVQPLIVEWLENRLIDRFFFIRYNLGGPHVRLRIRLSLPEARDLVRERLWKATEEFFADHPPPSSIPEEKIRAQTRRLAARDPLESDETTYPDLHIREVKFFPEIERYGGTHLLQASLDFFMVSSTVALDFLQQHGDKTWPRQLPQVLRTLIAQGKGLATKSSEVRELLRYGVAGFGADMPSIIERGDAAYEQQAEVFQGLVRTTPALGSDTILSLLYENSRVLSRRLDSVNQTIRRRILWSQMHMTSNRMGLNNPEEVYLSEIMARASEDVEVVDWTVNESPRTPDDLAAQCAESMLLC